MFEGSSVFQLGFFTSPNIFLQYGCNAKSCQIPIMYHVSVAQLVESWTMDLKVHGSNLAAATNIFFPFFNITKIYLKNTELCSVSFLKIEIQLMKYRIDFGVLYT